MALVCLLIGCNAGSVESPSDTSEAEQRCSLDAVPGVRFVVGYSDGYRMAQSADRPMLVFFTAQWCNYCHQMGSEAFVEDQVVRLSQQFVCILVDADREAAVCQEFGVRGFPTVQFLSSRGVPLNRLTGKTSADALAQQMQAALTATASLAERSRRSPVR